MAEQKTGEEKMVRVVWESGDDLPALYANHLYVSHGGEHEFYLIFGHLTPPLVVGFSEDEIPSEIKIKPVTKIVISPEAMRNFVKAMSDNLKRYEERHNK